MSKIDLKETMSIQSDHIDEDRSLGVFLLGDKCYIAMECSIDVYNIVTGVITERIPMINDGLLVVSRDKTSFFTSRLWGMIVYYCINTRLREEYPSLFGRVFDIVEGKPGITFACGNEHFVTMYNKFTQKAKMIRFPHNTLYMLYNHKTHLLFTVSAVGVFYCWDAENEVRLFEKQVNVTRVSDMIWKNESDIIILAQKSDWHRVDIKGSPIVIETMNDHSYVSAIAATPDQRYFITGGFSGHIYIRQGYLGECIGRYKIHDSLIVHVKVSDDGCFILAVDSNKRVKVLRLDCALAPVFYSGRITTHVGTPVTYAQLSASDGRVARIGAKDCELHTFLNITPETTLILNSKTDFSIKDRDRCQRVMTETEAEADEWMEAILAVCAHLKKPYKDRCMLPKAAITKSYRFDLLQLINRRNGGRGLLPGNTIPKSVMEIIGYYTME